MKPAPGDSLSWSRAYALQALSDLAALDAIGSSETDRCHWLHYLQMSAEKVCKAYLSQQNEDQVRKVHWYTTGTLPIIARQFLGEQGQKDSWQLRGIRALAHEIDLLAPASTDNGTRLDNCEYPWKDAVGDIHIPSRHDFEGLRDGPLLALIVSILRRAANLYTLQQ